MSVLRFTVLGRAMPAGSKRAFPIRKGGELTGKVAVVADNPLQVAWQDSVRAAAHQAANGDLMDGPLRLAATFYFSRPRSHYGTGRNSDIVKPNAPGYPAVKPDLSKLVRALEDGLTGIAITDDARVVAIQAVKRYGGVERTEVLINRVRTVGVP